LFDVNVLVALAWPNHSFHASAVRRLTGHSQPWATCAVTQLGFIRLSSNPAVVDAAVTPAAAAQLLAAMVQDPLHKYLSEPLPPVEVASAFAGIISYKKVTDAYLVKLAQRHRAKLLTFDARLRAMGEVEVLV
jgi:toxin-antitoxin system PIN domain toxin